MKSYNEILEMTYIADGNFGINADEHTDTVQQ